MASSNTSGGIGVPGFLLVVFITLKLCHVIDWSWWWVLSPALIPLALALLVLLFIGFCAAMARR